MKRLYLILPLALILCFMVGCKRTKIGKFVGAHMSVSTDELLKGDKISKFDYAGIVIVELKNGTKLNAICDTSIWSQLRGGQMLKIARFDSGVSTPDLRKGKEGRDIEVKWRVVEIVKTSEAETRPAVEIDTEAIKSLLNEELKQTKIAFCSNRDGNSEIYIMNADGSEKTNLTNNPRLDAYPSWSPDGKKIAFYSNRDGNPEIYIMNADGSEKTRLTNNPAQDVHPDWFPDGKKIVFLSITGGLFDQKSEVYVMNKDGSELTNLKDYPKSALWPSGSWSPDGKKIAFHSKRDGNDEIYVMNADGSELINLTNNPAKDNNPSWSPDGKKIAFSSDRDREFEIYVMNADGSELIRLTKNRAKDLQPSWSPDGKMIAFCSNRDGNSEIYIMNADGSEQTRLTSNPARDYYPVWLRF